MVYSGHLLTTFFEKPELDASLQVLLELHRRNPHADPTELASVSLEALQRYRTNAPAYIRTDGWRDVMLVAYLEAFHQVPGHTNFNPATFSLLHTLVARANAPTNSSRWKAELLNSANQRLLGTEYDLSQGQLLADTCTRRAQSSPAFSQAVEHLLRAETGVSLSHTPAQILATNAALAASPTMGELLRLSGTSGDGSVTLSTNLLAQLFTLEMDTLRATINTNRALQLELSQSQTDLLAYLNNPTAIAANAQREAAVKRGQAQQLGDPTSTARPTSRPAFPT